MTRGAKKLQLLVITLIKEKLYFRIRDQRVFKIQNGQEEITRRSFICPLILREGSLYAGITVFTVHVAIGNF